MEYKVTLGENKFVGFHERLTAGKENILVFESGDYSLEEISATITDGTFAKRHSLKEARFDITEYCKKAGVIEISLDLIHRDKVVKTWLLEPCVVWEIGNGPYELIPEIALLRQEIKTMKQLIVELNTKINETM